MVQDKVRLQAPCHLPAGENRRQDGAVGGVSDLQECLGQMVCLNYHPHEGRMLVFPSRIYLTAARVVDVRHLKAANKGGNDDDDAK